MKKSIKNSLGFTVVEVLIVIVVLALLGLAGWFVYHKQHDNKKASTSSNSSANAKKDDTTKNSDQEQSKTEYFTISEWKVRAPYTGTDRFTYKIAQDNKLLTAISKDLNASYKGCDEFGGGQIVRQKGTDTVTNEVGDDVIPVSQDATQHPNRYTQVGDYYYYFGHDQAQCGSAPIEAQNKANDALKALTQNLKAY